MQTYIKEPSVTPPFYNARRLMESSHESWQCSGTWSFKLPPFHTCWRQTAGGSTLKYSVGSLLYAGRCLLVKTGCGFSNTGDVIGGFVAVASHG